MILLDTIIATDEKGNTFEKKVTLRKYDDRYVIDFTRYAEYNIQSLLNNPCMNADDNELFCLDMMGRNHKGSAVHITIKQLRDMIELAQSFINKE